MPSDELRAQRRVELGRVIREAMDNVGLPNVGSLLAVSAVLDAVQQWLAARPSPLDASNPLVEALRWYADEANYNAAGAPCKRERTDANDVIDTEPDWGARARIALADRAALAAHRPSSREQVLADALTEAANALDTAAVRCGAERALSAAARRGRRYAEVAARCRAALAAHRPEREWRIVDRFGNSRGDCHTYAERLRAEDLADLARAFPTQRPFLIEVREVGPWQDVTDEGGEG